MKKNKKLYFTIIILVIVTLITLFALVLKSNKSIFSINEKQWIESNKNKVIDIAILNDVPSINYNGDGVLFSFLDDFEKALGLEFNMTSYKIDDDINSNYIFRIVDKYSSNDLLILRDNYVYVSKNNTLYDSINNFSNLKIGVLESDYDKFISILNDNNTLEKYSSITDLRNSLDDSNNELDGIIILKSLIVQKYIVDDLTIGYQFDDITKDFVLSLNGDEALNNIIRKYYNDWKNNNFDSEYNSALLNSYYKFKNIKDSDQTTIKSKKYVYGFVENGIYDLLSGSNLKGINNLVLKGFSDFSGVSITYKKFGSIKDLLNDYNNGSVDIFFNNTIYDSFDKNSLITKSGINSRIVFVSKYNSDILIDSKYGFNDREVYIVDSSYVEKYLDSLNLKYKKFSNMKQLLKNVSDDSLIAIDLDNYNYYKNSDLVDYKIDYIYNNEFNYKYVVNADEKNLSDLFDFYVNYSSSDKIISDGYELIGNKVVNYFYILVIVIILLVVSCSLISINKVKRYLYLRKKKRKINLSKTDKLKFIDQLTSLKNRAYLNSKIDSWDNSEVYPQAIIIIDLNNISYINDNYGREEGDRVIVEAANILISSQLSNSEIIRSDGDEFLIYLVGYNEKYVISYLRALSREMKKLSHGFGAATGYSMINDGIKTIDDAVNEATLEMKNNKEDITY